MIIAIFKMDFPSPCLPVWQWRRVWTDLLYRQITLLSRNKKRSFGRNFAFVGEPLRKDKPPNHVKFHQMFYEVFGKYGSLFLQASERETFCDTTTLRGHEHRLKHLLLSKSGGNGN
jgi:hypothetical protein